MCWTMLRARPISIHTITRTNIHTAAGFLSPTYRLAHTIYKHIGTQQSAFKNLPLIVYH